MTIKKILEQTTNIVPGDHLVALYDNEDDVVDYITAYIHSALQRNERCIYITGDADTSLVIGKVEELAGDVEQRGDLIVLNRNQAYSEHGKFIPDKMIALIKDLTETAISDGYSGMAITGEISWVLDYENGNELIIEYEWKLNEYIFDCYPVSALCRYNLNMFSDEMIINIIQLHPYILWNNRIHENPFYIPPEGYRNNSISKYQVEVWLQNINSFTIEKSRFRSDLEKKENEMLQLHQSMTNGIIMAMLEMLSLHDPYTQNHSLNVAVRARALAKHLELSDEIVTKIYYAGLVHDIGKILIQKNILNKEGRLTEEEYGIVKKHPVYGAKALGKIDKLTDISEAVRYHHERFDGHGYPEGLAEDKIPIMSRILSICDSYDAMIKDRPYRKGIQKEKVLEELIACAGSQYDPNIVSLFVELVADEQLDSSIE